LVKQFLFTNLEEMYGADKISIIKNSGRYIHLSYPEAEFKDVMSFCAAGTSLDSFQKCFYNGPLPDTKKHFPYAYFDTFDKLKETDFPPRSAFNNDLRGGELDEDLYEGYYSMYMGIV
jgi:hypothetical protein